MEPLKIKGLRDSVHGFIELHPLLVKVIDTPQFQRLRNIKQLGGNYHVYPGASHNRFEHSIGTCHLAGKLMRHLQKQQDEKIKQIKEQVEKLEKQKERGTKNEKLQKELDEYENKLQKYDKVYITNTDILCVEMAGLCHDLGHGPFSHLFDRQFMKKIKKKQKRYKEEIADSTTEETKEWKHERASCNMLDHLIKENKLKEEFKKYDLKEVEVELIKKMIDITYGFEFNDPHKQFLLEIVSNDKTGVDVDKWDYFARDCHQVGMKSTFDHNRFIALTRVVECEVCKCKKCKETDGKCEDCECKDKGKDCICMNGERKGCNCKEGKCDWKEWHIAVRDKEERNLYEMFHVRDLLHKRVYQHNVTKAVEEMISDALVLADEHIKIKGFPISETIKDMQVYQQLNDCILERFRYLEKKEDSTEKSENEKAKEKDLIKAKEILERIDKRDLYRYFHHVRCKTNDDYEKTEKRINWFLSNELDKVTDSSGTSRKNSGLNKEDFIIVKKSFNYGKGALNPVPRYWFYSKENPEIGKKIENVTSNMLPKLFQEFQCVIFNKKSSLDLTEKEKMEEERLKRNLKMLFPNKEPTEKIMKERIN